MHRYTLRWALAVLLAIAAATAHLRLEAAPLSEAEGQAVRMVLVAQFQAFADDDAEGAFATATPTLRESVGSPWRYLALIHGVYPMVYRPSSVTFYEPREDEGTVLQFLQITDDEGGSWFALFVLERQEDSTWRIAGCLVAENPWQAI
ncbi:MAG: hypothetical protein JWQ76_5677 [Ramlibacter sp.]|nr:hypothetical protein [Ramlibacter sp.]